MSGGPEGRRVMELCYAMVRDGMFRVFGKYVVVNECETKDSRLAHTLESQNR